MEAKQVLTSPIDLDEEVAIKSPSIKYRISWTASSGGKATIENDARVGIIRFPKAKRDAAAVAIQFFNDEGRRFYELEMSVLSQSEREYVHYFYPPALARTMKVTLKPARDGELSIEKLALTDQLSGKEAECLNVHPAFEFGDLNFYGYESRDGGGIYQRPDGVTVWNTGFRGESPSFPVEPLAYYTLSCRGTGYAQRKSWLSLQCFDKDGRKPIHLIPVKFDSELVPITVQVPAGATRANLVGYNVIVEEFKVTKAGAPAD